ncbi:MULTISPECIES: D-aminoacyl-tRNA deacylase [Thermodesulfovibrio]|jgi:D-tyrosyl-tRNA(Tyr) deacylase|uniref:D-aminoacyl-tRNA deacylase n=1 Tax=Thermodesulfovibrio TaxID=28261 RepID=UPI0026377C6C|nr:D-aminoacyl-tRNA deacylase [Thermodesulfovibrio sp.]
MIALIQRVSNASVDINEKRYSEIVKGLLVFVGIERNDQRKDADYLANKIVNMRIFEDDAGKMNLSIKDIKGEIMIVSEFTLAGDCRKGLRPSFEKAMPPQEAEKLYRYFIEKIKGYGINVKEGLFRSFMKVNLTNEGPVTFILSSR